MLLRCHSGLLDAVKLRESKESERVKWEEDGRTDGLRGKM